MAKNKVVHERNICIGCGACAATCPAFWEMADDGKSVLKGGKATGAETFELEVDELGCNKDAAEVCPVNCIHIIDHTGKKLI